MEDKLSFSIDEMSQLEALDIKGGLNASDFASDVIQNQCPNNVAGCACDLTPDKLQ